MTDKVEEIINDALGVKPKELVKKESKPIIPRPNENQDIDSDYQYQRENFYNLVERGQDAIQGILDVAQNSDHPRAYEVAGNLIKNVAEVTEKLGDLQEKMKKLKDVPNNAPKNVTNALFVGSTAELQKMLNKKSVETNVERKKENENFEGKNIIPEKKNTKD